MAKVAWETLFTKLLPCLCPGEYVALVGARLDGAEMLMCGLATHFVQSNVGSLVTSTLINGITTKHPFL
jgi:enoyl-CoA hydratase/carnithine racemase